MVPANGLILSVILFLSCSSIGFLILILRRVFLKGELGGTSTARYGSAFAFVTLWFIYVIFAGLGTYGVIDLDTLIKGKGPQAVAETFANLFEETKKRIADGPANMVPAGTQ